MSYSFPSGSGYLQATANVNIGAGDPRPISHAFWLKVSAGALKTTFETVCEFVNSAYTKGIRTTITSNSAAGGKGIGEILFSGANQDSRLSTVIAALDSGAWNHLLFTKVNDASTNANNWYLYFNGTNVTGAIAATSNDDYSSAISEIYMGKYTSGTVCKIAEFGIWHTELTTANISELYTSKYAPSLVNAANLRHYWSLNNAHTLNGREDQLGNADLTAVGTAVTDAGDHPAGMVYTLGGGTLKQDIPTTAPDGTVRKLFLFSDATTFATLLLNGVTVTASGGHFKYNDPAAVIGVKKPGLLTGFGADANAVAYGGPCWATGINE